MADLGGEGIFKDYLIKVLTFCLCVQKEIDELVEDWTPEPLVAAQTPFEEAENEKRPVIVG